MGVEGLLSVVKPLREEFTYSVVNPNLNDDFDYKYFLFDGSSWLWNVMRGNILMDFNYIRKRTKNLVNRCRSCGFELIVFVDANITNNKLDTWLSRRAQRVEKLYAMNHKMKSNKGNIQGFNNTWFAPCGAYFFCGQVFESLGCKVIYAHIDCDREMYGYYLLNKHYQTINGVIGFDTDFLIFNFPIYLELPSMRFHKNSGILTFQGHHHRRLLNRLHCKQRHLSRVASIMGCDVTHRLQTCGGSIDYAIKIVKETESAMDKQNQVQNGKKKKKNNRGYFGETHGGLKKRFSVSDTFYSGILPLDILPHSYLIMLLFQDYNERTDSVVVKTDRQNKMNKGGSPYHYVKGLIMDMAMDDAELIKNQKETSSIITLELRKWMYRILLSNVKKECDHEDGDTSAFDVMLDKKELRMKELICYAAPRLCFREDMTKREWLKGISVDVNGDNDEDNENPLYQLESYKFVKNALENEAKSDTDEDEDEFCVEIPQEYMVRDIIYLLTYLKDLDRKKVKQKQKEEEEKEKEEEIKSKTKEQKDDATHSQSANDANIPFVFGVADAGNDVNNDSLKTNGANTEIETNTKSEDKQWSTKKTKKDKKRKRGKRGRGGNKRKKQKTTHSTNNGQAKQKESVKKKKDKVKKTAKKKKKKKHGLSTWNEFKLLVNSFLYQWKYRDVFMDLKENDQDTTEEKKHKHAEFESHYMKINTRSMHYRSILYSIYEVIYAFLQMEFKCQWFGKYYCDFLRHHYNDKHKDKNDGKEQEKANAFDNIPSLKLLNGIECEVDEEYECECRNCKIRNNVDSWKERVIGGSNVDVDIQIPYVWEVLNTRVFHWIWAHYGKTKKWIQECRPNETLECL